eukprot:6420710-Amphidinium_carterae.3
MGQEEHEGFAGFVLCVMHQGACFNSGSFGRLRLARLVLQQNASLVSGSYRSHWKRPGMRSNFATTRAQL